MSANVRVVYNKLLGGWFVVRGPHNTPISGRFASKDAARAWLAYRRDPYGNASMAKTFWREAL